MATFWVKNRDFQRASGLWLQKARRGDTVVIVSSGGPPLTLKVGGPAPTGPFSWEDHFAWLQAQPLSHTNPVDELRWASDRAR